MDMFNTVSEAAGGLLKPQKVYLLFNRVSKAFMTWISWHEPHGVDETALIVVLVEEFSPQTQQVIGSYPDFKIVEIADQPQEIGEGYIDGMTSTEITERYSVARQLNNISNAILALSTHVGAEKLPELLVLEEQVGVIGELIDVGNLRKQGYQSDDSFNYVSNEAEAERMAAMYEGGLGEVIGPRQISAIRR